MSLACAGRSGGDVRGFDLLEKILIRVDADSWRIRDSPIWLQRYRQRTRHHIVLDFIRGRQRVLDVGCGSSRIVLDLPGAVGLDIRQNKLRWLPWRRRDLARASCERLPFADASFDGVIHSQVIEHVADDPAILAECHRVLRPGDILVRGTPDYGRWLWPVLEWLHSRILPGGRAHDHITRFTRVTLAERLRAAGFTVLDCRVRRRLRDDLPGAQGLGGRTSCGSERDLDGFVHRWSALHACWSKGGSPQSRSTPARSSSSRSTRRTASTTTPRLRLHPCPPNADRAAQGLPRRPRACRT